MLTGQLPYGPQVTRLRSPADTRNLRYVRLCATCALTCPTGWMWCCKKPPHPDPAKRQEAVSEFMHDLHFPSHGLQHRRAVPLIERNPVFWQNHHRGAGPGRALADGQAGAGGPNAQTPCHAHGRNRARQAFAAACGAIIGGY